MTTATTLTAQTAQTAHTAPSPVVALTTALPAGPQAPAVARRAASDFLDRHHPRLGSGPRDDVLLIVSELVTNAVRHALCPYALEVTSDHHGVLDIVVADGSTLAPAPRQPDRTEGTGGMGLHITEFLGARLTTERVPGGKRVHATLPSGFTVPESSFY